MLAAWLASLVLLQPQPTLFEAETALGQRLQGELVKLEADQTVLFANPEPPSVAKKVVRLRRAATPLPAWPTGPHLLLTTGERWPGRLVEFDGRTILFDPAWSQDPAAHVRVPISLVSVVWLDLASGQFEPHHLRWQEQKRSKDEVYLRNGDRQQGILTRLDPVSKTLQLQDGGRVVSLELARLAVIALNTDLARTPRPKQPYWRVSLVGGGRLNLTELTADATTLTGKTLFEVAVTLPLRSVVDLSLHGGPVVELSELKPSRYEYTPYYPTSELSWPLRPNRSVSGRALALRTKLGREIFDTGLGTHSQCRVTYTLDGQYRRLRALVGLHDDPMVGQRGSVLVDVLCDGQSRLPEAQRELTYQNGPRSIDLDLTEVEQLTLTVDFGRGADVQDHVDWVDARLFR